jgi:hypothetical protein
MRIPWRTWCYLFLLSVGAARAHPVAQGQMDIDVQSAAVRIHARVSNEQVFVANSLGTQGEGPAQSLEQAWQRHGQYLLRHLRVAADGRLLAGSATAGIAVGEFVEYDLQFPFAGTPRTLRIEQDMLNEIEFAPGNAWEASYVVRYRSFARPTQEGFLLTHQQPLSLQLDSAAQESSRLDKSGMFGRYLRHGFNHILSGYDHLLFIAALVVAAATLWDLLWVVTAFTLAHTLTLALSALDVVRLPAQIVEPMIAASIVLVAVANVVWPRQSRGWPRIALAFFFGLFHGLGFAGGLLSAAQGMSGAALFIAIAAFSVGVELGHQLIVVPLYGGLRLLRSRTRNVQKHRLVATETMGAEAGAMLIRVGSALISVGGIVYLIAALRY